MKSGNNQTGNFNGITQGTIWKQLLKFFFPILLGSLFQQLYNTVDAIIVGQILGKEALAAVGGGTSTTITLVIGIVVGLSSGAAVVVSQYFGAKDEEKVSLSIHNSMALALICGLVVSVVGVFVSGPLLRVIGTPLDIYPLALSYMRIFFAGGVFTVMYNMGSGIFRAFGDSRSPFIFLLIGSLTNIILDLIFVGLLKLGVDGAAYATVFSQAVSLGLVIIYLKKRNDCCTLHFRKLKVNSQMTKETLKIGLPSSIESALYTISNMIVQAVINGFGTDTAAAWAAYGKIDTVNWMVINSFGIAITTFVGQNYGAGLMDRVKKGVKDCLIMSFSSIALIEVVFLSIGHYGLLLFVKDKNVLELGAQIINSIAPFYVCYVCVEILSGAIRGTGRAVFTTLTSIFGICGFRAVYLSIIPRYFNSLNIILLCYAISWTITSTMMIVYYRTKIRKILQ